MRPYHKRPLNERVEKYNPVLNDKKVSFLETILENKAFEVCLRDLKKRAIILSSVNINILSFSFSLNTYYNL